MQKHFYLLLFLDNLSRYILQFTYINITQDHFTHKSTKNKITFKIHKKYTQ